jgi:hypothetical protein
MASIRKSLLTCLVLLGVFSFTELTGQTLTRNDFVSEASFVVGTFVPDVRDHSPKAIADSATAFLDSLDENLKSKCIGELDDPVRRQWTNLPAKKNADGVRLDELDSAQVTLACKLMANLFSEQGYNKMRDIMLADDQLLENGKARPGFGTEKFSVVIFGTPSETGAWGFQLDGHHVGVNLSLHGDKMTMSPSFIGTQPHAFKIGDRQFKPFKNETDLAHELAMSLSDEQAKQAVLNDSRQMIKTGPGKDGEVPEPQGISCSELSESQQAILWNLISQWVNDLPEPNATARMKQIKSELDSMKFSWNGNRKNESDVSYMIQSPTLVIEYACQDLDGNPLDHLHSNYRNPRNEYGGQLK